MLASAPHLVQIAELLGVGALAGLMGGMLGIGGGLVMIPALDFFVGDAYGPGSLHLFKLAAITTSVVVALPAAARHARAGAIIQPLLPAVLPVALLGVVAGTGLASWCFSAAQTRYLRAIFGYFLLATVAVNLWQSVRASARQGHLAPRCPIAQRRLLYGWAVGLPTGFLAGLLGIGGGVWNVPVMHIGFGVRLRHAVATSTAIVVGVSAITAIAQSVAVERMPDLRAFDGLWLTLWLAPGAVAGGWMGASLTHRIPLVWLRYLFYVLLCASAVNFIRG